MSTHIGQPAAACPDGTPWLLSPPAVCAAVMAAVSRAQGMCSVSSASGVSERAASESWAGRARRKSCTVRGELIAQAKSWVTVPPEIRAFTFYKASRDSQKGSWLKCYQYRLWIYCYCKEYCHNQTFCVYSFITAVLVYAVLTSLLIPDNGQTGNMFVTVFYIYLVYCRRQRSCNSGFYIFQAMSFFKNSTSSSCWRREFGLSVNIPSFAIYTLDKRIDLLVVCDELLPFSSTDYDPHLDAI